MGNAPLKQLFDGSSKLVTNYENGRRLQLAGISVAYNLLESSYMWLDSSDRIHKILLPRIFI